MTRKLREAREEGFTLIELLVVVIIIGILAAIAIPAFLSVRGNAGDATAQSDLRNAVIHLESYYTTNGDYNVGTGATAIAALEANGWEVSDDSTNVVVAGDADSFCVSIQSSESTNYWGVSSLGNNEPQAITAATACSDANTVI